MSDLGPKEMLLWKKTDKLKTHLQLVVLPVQSLIKARAKKKLARLESEQTTYGSACAVQAGQQGGFPILSRHRRGGVGSGRREEHRL